MNFPLILKDELNGFYKSWVMIFLWIGLPLLAIFIHISIPNQAGLGSLSILTALILTSIASLLSSTMLAANIINEKDTHVYPLFLIRPIKRWQLIISKFLAVYICVSIALIISIMLGITIDYIETPNLFEFILESVIDPFIMVFAIMLISSAFGTLIGVLSPSIVVGVVLVIFLGQYVSYIPTAISFLLNIGDPLVMVLVTSIITASVLLGIAILVFSKKQF